MPDITTVLLAVHLVLVTAHSLKVLFGLGPFYITYANKQSAAGDPLAISGLMANKAIQVLALTVAWCTITLLAFLGGYLPSLISEKFRYFRMYNQAYIDDQVDKLIDNQNRRK